MGANCSHSLSSIEELRELEASLVSFVESCGKACCQGFTRDCTVSEALSTVEPGMLAARQGGCCAKPPQQKKKAAPVKSTAFKQIRRT